MKPTCLLMLICAMALCGCARLKPSEVPEEGALVAVKDWQFRPGSSFPEVTAHHSFIDIRDKAGKLQRFEVLFPSSRTTTYDLSESRFLQDERKTRPINLRTLVTGPKATRIIKLLRENAVRYEAMMIDQEVSPPMNYRAWPGPNSNTFVAWMLRETDELSATLPHAAIGKDFALTIRTGPSDSEDGWELETAFLGAEVGLYKGVELHVLQLTFGVALFPPAIKLPGLPVLGFEPAQRIDHSEEYEPAADKTPKEADFTPKKEQAKAK